MPVVLPAVMSLSSVKGLGKRVVDYPEETVPVASVTEWVGNPIKNPVQRVRTQTLLLFCFPIIFFRSRNTS